MRKLKLESLQVESFETATVPHARGTVDGHAQPTRQCPLETYNVERCGDTLYFDCTLGCSRNTDCPDGCVVQVISDVDCTVA